MLVLVDNYDSFVHTLARYCVELGVAVRVVRNDAVGVDDLSEATAALLSPGPCGPDEAGICQTLVRELDRPILGVCLGHQAIVAACGGTVSTGSQPTHGRASLMRHEGDGLFDGLPNPMPVGRYHSLIATALPPELAAIGWLDDGPDAGTVMAVRHRERPVYGVQFHPESVLSPGGRQVLANFLTLAGFDGVADPAATAEETFTLQSDAAGDDFYAQPGELAYPLPSAGSRARP